MIGCYRVILRVAASRRCLVALAIATGASCGGSRETTGPCYVQYEEPLFTITGASDAHTGAALQQVVLTRFTYEGRSDLGLDFLTNHLGLEPRNAAIENGELVCDIECAFGGPAGSYTFTFRASGYRDTTFTIDSAEYANAQGDCPAILSDGMNLELVLTPG
jgi:hypothetical protein